LADRLLLAEDHVVVREGLIQLLLREGFEVVAEVSTGRDAVESARKLSPDVAVLDVSMPLLNGIDAARAIRVVSPHTKSVILTIHTEEQYVLSALRAGIEGYVVKMQAGSDLVDAIRTVLRGDLYLSPRISAIAMKATKADCAVDCDFLTLRERQILQLIAEGSSNKQISRQLDVSIKTVESHRGNLMKKLDIHETAGLVRHAIKIGLIQP